MKILFIHTDLMQGGSANQITSLAAATSKRGHEVIFLTYYNHLDYDFYVERLENCNILRIRLNCRDKTKNESHKFKKLLFKVKSLWKIRRFIRKSSYDAVVSFLPEPDFINICSAYPFKKWKIVIGERSADPNTPKEIAFYRKFYRFADSIVTNSKKNWEIINKRRQVVREDKQHVIYNSVDTDYFKPDENYIYRHDEKLRIVVLGRYTVAKNLDNLVKAVSLLRAEEKKQLEISWYGHIQNHQSQLLYDKAFALIDKYCLQETVRLNNHPANSYEMILNADAVGLFSIFEGLPNAVCEGMSCGKPIIMTDVSDAKHFVQTDVNGILIGNTDAESISKGLSALLTLSVEKLQLMGKKSRELAEQLFDAEKAVEQYLDLLK
jgi:glycosyltransferase involved in cell wall biosynthesis